MKAGYEDYFGMMNTPFTRGMPPEHLCLSAGVEEAKSRIRYAIDKKLFAVMFGDTGMGKTSIVRAAISELPAGRYQVMYFSESGLTPRRLYSGMLSQMGIEIKDFRTDLRKAWRDNIPRFTDTEKQKVVCIIDDANLIEDETIEELRFIMSKDYDSDSYIAVILAGLPALWNYRLRTSSFEPIRQRVDICISLPRMEKDETTRYVKAQLDYAGGRKDIFPDSTMGAISRISHGVPRLVNRICEASLRYAAQNQLDTIDGDIVKAVCKTEFLIPEESE